MKRTVVLLAIVPLLLLMTFLNCERNKVSITGVVLADNAVNVATILIGYQDLQVKGVHFQSFPPTAASKTDTLPIRKTLFGNGDIMDILFQLDIASDTLFHGTEIWDGKGKIFYPQNWKKEFVVLENPPALKAPLSTSFFENAFVSYTEQEVNAIWELVKKITITHEFAKQPYHLGIYLYTPSIYFDMSSAHWVVFLYCRTD